VFAKYPRGYLLITGRKCLHSCNPQWLLQRYRKG
jgi:hypothetical protein